MKFQLLDGQDADILGGPVSEKNVYIKLYGVPLEGEKRPADLQVGESTYLKFNLSGTSGVYRALRVE